MGTWAIPWLADARIIFYWRDMLERASVDEGTAFQTPEHVEETMARLQASDVETPWGWWATTTATMLQCASSWVWEAGGDYVSTDGRKVLFSYPEALRGFVAYLKLHRYMPPWIRHVGDIVPINSFAGRQAAVAIGTPGWLPFIYESSTLSDAPDRLGIAAPPGPSFVGGSALVIWQHTRRLQEAVELVRFLTGQQVQSDYVRRMQHLPARLDVLAEPPYTTDAHYQAMAEALRTGRTYPIVPKWGDIEKKLMETLTQLWNDLLADPEQDVEALAGQYLDALARRLTITLGTRR
jgi:multiple sugar transport system substrate-binding protein